MIYIEKKDLEFHRLNEGCQMAFLSTDPDETQFTFLQAQFAPGHVSETHVHKRSTETFYGLAGRGLITVEGQPIELGAGDCLQVQPGERHSLQNPSEEAFHFLILSSPPAGAADTFLPEETERPSL